MRVVKSRHSELALVGLWAGQVPLRMVARQRVGLAGRRICGARPHQLGVAHPVAVLPDQQLRNCEAIGKSDAADVRSRLGPWRCLAADPQEEHLLAGVRAGSRVITEGEPLLLCCTDCHKSEHRGPGVQAVVKHSPAARW